MDHGSPKSSFVVAGQESQEAVYHSDFQDLCLINPDQSFFKVSSIRVYLNLTVIASLITGVELSYVNLLTGATIQGRLYHGTQKMNKVEEARLENDEFITGVFGNCQNHLHKIGFKTTKGRKIEFGRAQKQEFCIEEKENTHLTSLRVGTSKAIRYIVFQRTQIRIGGTSVSPIVINFTEPAPRLSLKGNSSGKRFSDFKVLDSLNISAFFTKVERISFEMDNYGITFMRLEYSDVRNFKFVGVEMGDSSKSILKQKVSLEEYEFLVAIKAFSSKTHIHGLQLSLSTGKVLEIGSLVGNNVAEAIAPLEKHLTAFESSFSFLLEDLSAHFAPISNFQVLFSQNPVSEQTVRIIEEKEDPEPKGNGNGMEEEKFFLFGPGTVAKSKCAGENPSERAVYFDDMMRFKGKQESLLEISVFFDNEGICGMMSTYSDEKGFLSQGGSTLFPLDNRKCKRLVLNENEKIVEVSGCLKPGRVAYLKFKTTRNNSLEVGDLKGTPFANLVKEGCFLAGFGGFVDNHLESFFIYQSHRNIF